MSAGPRTIVVTSAPGGEPLGLVCVDSTVNGCARGGLRLLPDVTPHELELLARAMTLKYGFLGLPQGGAKAGVFGDPDAPPDARAACLRRFAEAAAPLLGSRVYVPDSDMGTTGAEIQAMLEAVGIRVARREYRGGSSGLYTAATVFASARAAANARGLALPGCRVAIEGFGRVGLPLARMFVRAGAIVVAIATRRGGVHNPRGLDVEAAAERVRTGGEGAIAAAGLGDPIGATDLNLVPADVLCPCARHESITLGDADAIEAAVISCGANSPVTPDADGGSGSAASSACRTSSRTPAASSAARWSSPGGVPPRFSSSVITVFDRGSRPCSRRPGSPRTSVREVAEAFARRRFAEVKHAAERGSWQRRGTAAALGAYRDGWLPARLVRRLSDGYFRRRVG